MEVSVPQNTLKNAILIILAAIGLIGVNGVFLYHAFSDLDSIKLVNQEPVAAAFMVEALVLTGLLAWFFQHIKLRQYNWIRFIILSLLGSLLFSVPVTILMHSRGED